MPVRLQSATARLARLNPSLEAFSPNFDGTVDAPASFTATIGANLQADTASFLGNYQAVSDITGTIGVTLDNFTSNITSVGGSSEPYDLGTIPFSYNWPDAPVTTQTVNITANDGAGLLSAMQAGSRTINVPAGTYSANFQNLGSDIDLVLDNNAVLVGSWNIRNISRVRITGGVLDGNSYSHTFYCSGGPTTDILLNNVRMDDFNDIVPGFGTETQRFAMVNSTANSQRYCFLSQEFAGSDHQDIIIANCDLFAGDPSGEESTIRMMYVTRGLVIDNRLRNGGKHTLRTHFECDYIYYRNNQIETGNGLTWAGHPIGGGVLQCNRGWILDNDFYDGGLTVEGYQYNGGGVNELVMTGNTEYQSSATAFPTILGSQGPSWTVNNNQDLGPASPPAWSGGADH